MTATTPALTSRSLRGSGRQPWLCAHSMPASPRQARMSPAYSRTSVRTFWCASDGSKCDSGSVDRQRRGVRRRGPDDRCPAAGRMPDTVMATRGLASLLQASLRITVLMTRSTRPLPATGRCGAAVDGRNRVCWLDSAQSVPAADDLEGLRNRARLPGWPRRAGRLDGRPCHLGHTSISGPALDHRRCRTRRAASCCCTCRSGCRTTLARPLRPGCPRCFEAGPACTLAFRVGGRPGLQATFA